MLCRNDLDACSVVSWLVIVLMKAIVGLRIE
jgi:hypothetical protein